MKYKVVQIEFLDHVYSSHGKRGPSKCLIWGVLFDETQDSYFVCPWATDKDPTNDDSDVYTIVKHPGVKVKKIGEIEMR